MDVRNCRQCHKIFNYVAGAVICPKCREENEAKFQECKKHVSEHKGITINELAEACDVEPSLIRQWLREERLRFAEGSLLGLECESCGVSIVSGRYCAKCKANLTNALNGAYSTPKMEPASPEKKSGGNRMRFIDN